MRTKTFKQTDPVPERSCRKKGWWRCRKECRTRVRQGFAARTLRDRPQRGRRTPPSCALADSAHDFPPIGSPSGQQDYIHFPTDISGLRSDILGDVENKGLHPDLCPDITILSPADNLLEVIRPEERHGSALAHQFLLYLRFGIFTAVAEVNQLETRTRADSLRGERPVSSDSVVGINHLSVPVKSDGDPAAKHKNPITDEELLSQP